MKLQLLERADRKKWVVWQATGLVNQKVKQLIQPFFDSGDAIADFEKLFEKHTENQWKEREFFQTKPGKYSIKSEEKEKEKLEIAKEQEREVTTLMQGYFDSADELSEFVKFIYSR